MHKAIRLQETLFNIPLLITPTSLEGVVSYLNERNSGEFELSASNAPLTANKEPDFDTETKTGTLKIHGPLSYRSTILTSLCSLTSYQALQNDFKRLISMGAQRVVMDVSSGGGEAYSCFETAALIRKIADQNNVKLVSYVDGLSASAAFALSCVAHEVVVNPQAEVGSIGVVIKLRNSSQALAKAGLEDTFIFAGNSKIPFDQDGSWNTSFISDLQAKVDTLYGEFTAFVAKHRKLSVDVIAGTQAKTFLAQDAVKLGLADKIMTREEFSKYLSSDKKQMTKPELREAIKSVPSRTPKAQQEPAGYFRNTTTGMLQPIPPANPLSEEGETSRMERLSNFDRKSAAHILKATLNLPDSEFEKTVTRMEYALLGINK